MDADKLEAIITAAVMQYADAAPADRPAIAETAAGAIFALLWALDETDRHEAVRQLVVRLIVERARGTGDRNAEVKPPGRDESMRAGVTTAIGYVNRNGQEVIRATGLLGTDHLQRVYVLRCRECGCVYGANGSDIWERRCPKHQGGKPGLPIE